MSILSKIRNWFGGAKSLANAPSINETAPQKETKEIERQDSKAEKLIEAIKVAHEEQPQNEAVKSLAIQPESTPVTVTSKIEDNVPSNIQSIQPENISIPASPKIEENIPSQDVQPEFKVAHEEQPRPAPVQPIASQPENIPSSIQPEIILSHDNLLVQYDSPPTTAPTSIVATPPDASNAIQRDNLPAQPQPELKVKRQRKSTRSRCRSRKKLKESANPET